MHCLSVLLILPRHCFSALLLARIPALQPGLFCSPAAMLALSRHRHAWLAVLALSVGSGQWPALLALPLWHLPDAYASHRSTIQISPVAADLLRRSPAMAAARCNPLLFVRREHRCARIAAREFFPSHTGRCMTQMRPSDPNLLRSCRFARKAVRFCRRCSSPPLKQRLSRPLHQRQLIS